MPEFMFSPSTGRYFYQHDEGEYIEVPSHVAETGLGERILIGAGRQALRIGRGIADFFNEDPERARLQAEENALYEPLAETFPVSTGFGEAIPGLATVPIGLGLGGAAFGRGAQFAAGVGLPALEGLAAFRPDEGGQIEQGIQGAAFGLGGQFVGNMASRVLRGIASASRPATLTDDAARLTRLAGEDVLTPGQKSANPGLRQFEESIRSNPLAADRFAEKTGARQRITNQRVAEAIGVPGENQITDEVLAEAQQRATDFYEQFATGRGLIELDETLAKRISSRKEIKDIIDLGGLEGLEDGVLRTGEDILNVRSTLTGLIADATGTKSGQFRPLQRLLQEFDDQVAFNFGPEEVAQLNKVNEHVRNLALVERLGVVKDGDVSANLLKNRMQQNYGKTFTQNRLNNVEPETANLMQWVKAETAPGVKPIVGTSGTAERLSGIQQTGDIAQGVATGDLGALARGLGPGLTGTLYSRLAFENPGFFTGLLTPPGALGSRLGSQLLDENSLDLFTER